MDQQLSVWATATHQFSSSAEQVFEGWLDTQIMLTAFFGSDVTADDLISSQSEPFIGGHFAYIASLNGVNRSHLGEYLEIRKPSRLVFSWQANWVELPASKICIDIVDNAYGSIVLLKHELPFHWAELVWQAEAAWIKLLADFDRALIHSGQSK